MTVPFIKYSDLVNNYLIPNGFTVENPQAQDFWNEHNRIMIKRGDYIFPLQFREVYFYLQVVILFNSLGIPVPEDHQKCYDQHMELRNRKKDKSFLKETEEDSSKNINTKDNPPV